MELQMQRMATRALDGEQKNDCSAANKANKKKKLEMLWLAPSFVYSMCSFALKRDRQWEAAAAAANSNAS